MAEWIAEQIGWWALVVSRMCGLFVFAPVFSSLVIPVQARVGLAIAMGLACGGLAERGSIVGGIEAMGLVELAWAMVMETMVGVFVGLVALLPMTAVQIGGQMMGQQMGLGLGLVYNPALDVEADEVSQLLVSLALGAFVIGGGLEVLFVCMAGSFEMVPAGWAGVGPGVPGGGALAGVGGGEVGGWTVGAREVLVGSLASGLELALRVSAPVLGLVMVESLVSGVIMKTMPQINVMSVGFIVRIALSLCVLAAGVGVIDTAVGEHIGETLRELTRAVTAAAR